jgi:preprotein translocase subunit SecB
MSKALSEDLKYSPEKALLKRVYIKDSSFESPSAPGVFSFEWKPTVSIDFSTQARSISKYLYEVLLRFNITVKTDNLVAYLVEVQQGGLFTIKDHNSDVLRRILTSFCPSILFPYAREAIDNLIQKGSFPVLMLGPINFDLLYAKKFSKEP